MEWAGFRPVSNRRAFVALGLAALLCAASGLQAQAAQTPAAPPQAADMLKFATDSPVQILFSIKADKTADFETAWNGIRTAFAKAPADKADLKAFGDSLAKMYRVDLSTVGGAPAGTPAIYILLLEMPSKTISYNPGKIIYETLYNNGNPGGILTRPEADELYKKLSESYQAINPWPLVKIGG